MLWKKKFKYESCNKRVVINLFEIKMLIKNLRKELLLTGEDK